MFLITLRSIENRQHSYARKLARRLPALYLATLGQLNRAGEIFLSPTHPPLAPVRSRPSASAPGRARPDSSLPPAPPAGGLENKTMQHVRSLAGTRLRFASLRSAWSPLAHYAPLDREPGALLRSQARSSAPCPLSRYFGTVKPSKGNYPLPHPPPARACPFTSPRFRSGRARADSSLPPAPPAGGSKNKTILTKQKKKNICRAPQPRRVGPRTPLAPCLRRSARACFAINTIMNK